MQKKGMLLAAVILSMVLAPIMAAAGQYPAIRGMYMMQGTKNLTIDSVALDSPSITGITIQADWNVVEPTEGTYDWSLFDNDIAQAQAAGKVVSIFVVPGYATPSWVYADGAQSVKFVWDQPTWGPALCSVQTIPVPWDPVYLSKWSTLVQAFGARYASNPTVVSIKVTGINSETGEINLPFSNQESINSGGTSCTGYNDVAIWQGVGYTRTLVENAWSAILPMFQTAFPNRRLEPMMGPWGFPPLDDNGDIIQGQPGDPYVSADLVATAVSVMGKQLVLQNDGLSQRWIWPVETGYANQILTGYQMVGIMGNNLGTAMNMATAGGAHYIEIREQDLENNSLQGLIAATSTFLLGLI